MTTLTGTEKQIAWATDIRSAKMERWTGVISDLNKSQRARNQMLVGIIQQIVDLLANVDDAAIWIEGRDDAGSMLHSLGILRPEAAARFGTDVRELRNVYTMMG